jgi:hypothetical protein
VRERQGGCAEDLDQLSGMVVCAIPSALDRIEVLVPVLTASGDELILRRRCAGMLSPQAERVRVCGGQPAHDPFRTGSVVPPDLRGVTASLPLRAFGAVGLMERMHVEQGLPIEFEKYSSLTHRWAPFSMRWSRDRRR